MNKLAIIFVVLIVIGVTIEAILLLKINPFATTAKELTPGPIVDTQVSTQNIAPAEGKVHNVKVTNDGFSPSTVKVRLGDKVIWTNSSDTAITVNSDPHPGHTQYEFLNLGEAPAGQTLRLIFRQIGTFTYHNNFNPSQKGTVIVE